MAVGPNTQRTTMYFAKDLLRMIDRRAKKHDVSRTRMIEWVLRDYVSKSDAELRDIVTAPKKEIVDVDLFA